MLLLDIAGVSVHTQRSLVLLHMATGLALKSSLTERTADVALITDNTRNWQVSRS